MSWAEEDGPACLPTCLQSVAISKAVVTESGSSPLQWKMGTSKALPRSVQYGVDRDDIGSVVNPT